MQRAFDTLDKWCAQPRCISDLYHSGFLFYGFAAWWSLFGIAALVYSLAPVSRTFRECLSSSQRAEWISRVVSNVNAAVMVSVSSVLLQQVWSAELQHGPSGPVLPHAASFYISHALLLCYFCYDASLILLFLRSISSPWSSLAHHVFSALSVVFCYFVGQRQPLAFIWATGIMLTEISTPLVNARWFLSFRYRERWQYKAVGLGMLLAFVVGRVLYIPLLVFAIARSAPSYLNASEALSAFWLGLVGGSASLGIWLLNVYWTMLMFRGARKLFGQQRRAVFENTPPMHPAHVGLPTTTTMQLDTLHPKSS
ncbi:hypothetical protein CCYA_CCYA01G0068 [Cyanidiococcus yangmingshanensis]|nr:hypothetical protein CCYA_CCYA01G0068 [Cyanidiococcus yangmingshanensis]